MNNNVEKKLEKIPVVNLVVRFGKRIKIPGLQGMSLYDVIEMYIIGILEGALTTRASGIAYSFFMAIFPFMLFILTLIPYIPIEGFQESLLTLINEILPPKTYEAVDSVILDIINNKQVGLLSFGFLASIFLMTNGINAIFGGFEHSYHVTQVRNIFRSYFISMLVSVIMAIFLIITVALTGFYRLVLDAMIKKEWITDETLWFELGRGAIFLIMIFTIVSILYKYGTKEGKHTSFFSAGSIFTTFISIFTFYLFSIYVTEFAQYNKLYGSIGTLLILMLFIWLNAIILLLGFELNASIYALRLKNQESRNID